MVDFWDSLFKTKGSLWEFEPAESAKMALQIFDSIQINNILIPGTGYGRNAKLFLDHGYRVTGIEISKSAIEIANANNINCKIHHGSVTSMPFDNEMFDGIFCYALIHLFNYYERKVFLESCYKQLNTNGIMIFITASTKNSLFDTSKLISKNRCKISNGLDVYFYDSESINKEFTEFGLIESKDIDEPVKFMEGQETMKFKIVVCRKNNSGHYDI